MARTADVAGCMMLAARTDGLDGMQERFHGS